MVFRAHPSPICYRHYFCSGNLRLLVHMKYSLNIFDNDRCSGLSANPLPHPCPSSPTTGFCTPQRHVLYEEADTGSENRCDIEDEPDSVDWDFCIIIINGRRNLLLMALFRSHTLLKWKHETFDIEDYPYFMLSIMNFYLANTRSINFLSAFSFGSLK